MSHSDHSESSINLKKILDCSQATILFSFCWLISFICGVLKVAIRAHRGPHQYLGVFWLNNENVCISRPALEQWGRICTNPL